MKTRNTYADYVRGFFDPRVRRQSLFGHFAVGEQRPERLDAEDEHDAGDQESYQAGCDQIVRVQVHDGRPATGARTVVIKSG